MLVCDLPVFLSMCNLNNINMSLIYVNMQHNYGDIKLILRQHATFNYDACLDNYVAC